MLWRLRSGLEALEAFWLRLRDTPASFARLAAGLDDLEGFGFGLEPGGWERVFAMALCRCVVGVDGGCSVGPGMLGNLVRDDACQGIGV